MTTPTVVGVALCLLLIAVQSLALAEDSPGPTSILLDGSLDDWAAIPSVGSGSDVSSRYDVDLLELKLTHDDQALFVAYHNEDPIVLDFDYGLYLDVDRNPATGFAFNGLGVDYLIEGSLAYQYTGAGPDWSWQFSQQVDSAIDGNTAELSIPRALLGAGPSLNYLFRGYAYGEKVPYGWGYLSYVFDPSGNSVPVGVNAEFALTEMRSVSFVLDGFDADGDPLSFTLETDPAHGALAGTPPSLTYTPVASFVGQDSLRFSVSDGMDRSAEASVSFYVQPETAEIVVDGNLNDWWAFASVGPGRYLDDMPEIDVDLLELKLAHGEDSLFVAYQNESPITLGADYALYIDLDRYPGTGYRVGLIGAELLIEGASVYRYVGPGWNWQFVQQLDWAVSGNNAELSIPRELFGTIQRFDYHFRGDQVDLIEREAIPGSWGYLTYVFNGEPRALDAHYQTGEAVPVSFVLQGVDFDDSPLSFELEAEPLNGQLTGEPPSLTYAPLSGFIGTDSLSFTVNNGTDGSVVANVTIDVQSVASGIFVVDGSLDDWWSVPSVGAGVLVPDVSDYDVDLLALRLAHDDDSLFVAYHNEDPIIPWAEVSWPYALYIDADSNPATGYAVGTIGADYLIEGGTLYAYTGNGSDWSWSWTRQLDYAISGNTAELVVPRALLGPPASLDFFFQGEYRGERVPASSGHLTYGFQ